MSRTANQIPPQTRHSETRTITIRPVPDDWTTRVIEELLAGNARFVTGEFRIAGWLYVASNAKETSDLG